MRMRTWAGVSLISLVFGAGAGTVSAQTVSAAYLTPAIDRWMYSFDQTPGTEAEARVFSPLFSPYQSSFDNRDGQFLVAWDTAGLGGVPSGQAPDHYRIIG